MGLQTTVQTELGDETVCTHARVFARRRPKAKSMDSIGAPTTRSRLLYYVESPLPCVALDRGSIM